MIPTSKTMAILKSKEVEELKKIYEERFHVRFPCFSYWQFKSGEDYKETIEKALRGEIAPEEIRAAAHKAAMDEADFRGLPFED